MSVTSTYGTGYYQWRENSSLTGVPVRSPFADDVQVSVPAQGLAVPVALVKAGLPAPTMTYDDLLSLDIEAVTDQIEKYTRRDLLRKTRIAVYFAPADYVFLPFPPTAVITSVESFNRDGDTQAMTLGTDYFVRGSGDNVQVYDLVMRYPYLRITYTSGYGQSSDIPAALRKAIVQECFRQFKYRQDPIIASDRDRDGFTPETYALIRSYVVRRTV